ncbi:MAG: efflux RND transporter periplasmic adaptor subunit [Acidobacteriota bacterium]|nr:efflux RND transporter periplasmic adaptor subunit [Acidobacteriota bacterium]
MRRKLVISTLTLIAGLLLFLNFQRPQKGIGTSRPEEADREVLVLRVAPRVLPRELSEAGLLAGWREVDVVAEASGRVVAPPVEVGTDVAAGEQLALVDPTALEIELRKGDARVRQVELASSVARREARRLAPLRDDGVVSESDWSRAADAVRQAEAELALAEAARDAAREALADASVRAPFAGRVVRRYAELGEFVAVGSPIARVVDLSRLRLRLGAPAAMAAALQPGLEASVVVDTYPGERFAGRVHCVAGQADANGLFPIDVVTAGRAGRPLLPGMVARAHLVAGRGEPRLLVPPSAVARRDGRDVVFVVDEAADRARMRAVSLGARNGRAVEVVDGIAAGELIAYQGHSGLEDGDAVRVLTEAAALAPDLGAAASGSSLGGAS